MISSVQDGLEPRTSIKEILNVLEVRRLGQPNRLFMSTRPRVPQDVTRPGNNASSSTLPPRNIVALLAKQSGSCSLKSGSCSLIRGLMGIFGLEPHIYYLRVAGLPAPIRGRQPTSVIGNKADKALALQKCPLMTHSGHGQRATLALPVPSPRTHPWGASPR